MQSQSEMPLVRDGLVESWWTELVEYWHRLPNRDLFLWLMAAWLLLFQFLGSGNFGYIASPSLFKWMFVAYNADSEISDDAHGNLVPFVVLALFWWKRKELFAAELRVWAPATVIILAAALLHIAGYLVQQQRISILAMLLGIYGIMGLAWGPDWLRKSLFPFALTVFMVPMGSLTENITFPLRLLVTVLVEFVAGTILGIDVVRVGTGLFDSAQTYQFDVAPACSGIRSLVAIFFLCTAYGYMAFRRSWRWGLMIAAAFPLAVLGNMVRLLLIVVAASLFGQETGAYVHDNPFFSMIPYIPAVLGIIYLERGLNWLHAAIQKENARS
jgi:exosortase